MNKETFSSGMSCENCGNHWFEKIPVGYVIYVDTETNEPLARKEKGSDIRRFTCPTCQTKSKVRWG